MEDVTKHEEVVSLTCSLLSDPLPLVKHIYKLYVDWKAQAITSEDYEDSNYEEEFCSSLSTEAKFDPSKTGVKSLTELVLGKVTNLVQIYWISVFSGYNHVQSSI